jgi:hypothetical protein
MAEFVAGVIAIALYLTACYFAVVYVVDPAWPYMAIGGAAAGALTVVFLVIGTLLRFGDLGARTITPADVPARLPAIRSAFPRDDAWPNYLFGQVRTDLRAALGHVGHVVGRMWARMLGVVREEPLSLAAWPLLLLPLTAAVAGTAAAVATVVVLGAVLGAVLAVSRLGWLIAVGLLRGVDLGLRVLRRAKATCTDGACTYRTRLPAYRCTCGRIHHDIRAGRQGLFVRRCACGRLLPTTVSRAAAGLVALCQNCERDLRAGAGTFTDVVMPVFGSTSAGKTRLIYAGMVALSRHLPAVGGTFTPDGVDSEATFRSASTVVEGGTQTTKTAADRPPAGITVRLGTGRRPAMLHLFDAAGEAFSSRDQAADLRFLDDPQGMVFVLDPFSMPEVAAALRGALASRLTEAEPAFLDPEESYFITVSWLRDQGVALRRKPLAVAVVKADLLLDLPPAEGLTPESTSDDIARWLRRNGLDNLLDGMGRDFREVTFHLVASRDAGVGPDGAAGPTSAARPLLWLLRRTGVAVPGPVVAGAT